MPRGPPKARFLRGKLAFRILDPLPQAGADRPEPDATRSPDHRREARLVEVDGDHRRRGLVGGGGEEGDGLVPLGRRQSPAGRVGPTFLADVVPAKVDVFDQAAAKVNEAGGAGDVEPRLSPDPPPIGGQRPEFHARGRLDAAGRRRAVERQAAPRLAPLKPHGKRRQPQGQQHEPEHEPGSDRGRRGEQAGWVGRRQARLRHGRALEGTRGKRRRNAGRRRLRGSL